MKLNPVIKLSLLVLFCLNTTWGKAQKPDWANLGRYAKENVALKQTAAKDRPVVFMGNSITEFWVKLRPDFFTKNQYVGRGISGQTSYQFLVRFREDVINLSPKVVVINAGTNDIAENTGAYNEEYTFGNIVSMVELAQSNRIKVVLTTVLPAKDFGWNPSVTDAMEKIRSLNRRVEEYARKHRIPFVNYFIPMLSRDGKALDASYTNDGVHPTAEGYSVMEPLVKKAIEPLLK